jgi:hypothetical protein
LALLTDAVSGFKFFSESPCLAWKCGTRTTNSPGRTLQSTAPRSWLASQTRAIVSPCVDSLL